MLFTDAPATWPNPAQPSVLQALLVFVGVPLLITAIIVLLVMGPSLAKGPRYSPGQAWDADPQWFGAPEQAATLESRHDHLALESSGRASPLDAERESGSAATTVGGRPIGTTEPPKADPDTGGASVRW